MHVNSCRNVLRAAWKSYNVAVVSQFAKIGRGAVSRFATMMDLNKGTPKS